MSQFRYSLRYALGAGFLPAICSCRNAYCPIRLVRNAHYISFLIFTMLYMITIWVIPALIFSVVTVSMTTHGIATYWCGLRTQSYAWVDIIRIRKMTNIGSPNWPPNEHIEIIKTERRRYNIIYNAFGSIMINDLIIGYPDFRSQLNKHAIDNKIALYLVDVRAARSNATPPARREAMVLGTNVEQISPEPGVALQVANGKSSLYPCPKASLGKTQARSHAPRR